MDFIVGQKEFPWAQWRCPALCFLHLSIAAMYGRGLHGYYDMARRFSTGAPEEFAGFFKYLTFWNLIFQFIFFALSAFIDVFISECDPHIILSIRDFAFAGIVFPYGVFVTLMFWGIIISNRRKILPEEAETIFPVWLNHVSHTVLLPVVLLEACIVYHRYPDTIEGFALTLSLGVAYLTWVLCLGIAKDIWVYIFLKDFNHFSKGAFFVLSIILAFLFCCAGEYMNYAFWGVL